uniref:Uncharacterized protein n=1 Tax=Anguilla anguilla TaxID=7936 RepID=A0A0E9PTR3_ANGAN
MLCVCVYFLKMGKMVPVMHMHWHCMFRLVIRS